MPEAGVLLREGPLASGRPVSVALQPAGSRFSARGGPEVAARIGTAFGVALPTEALRAVASAERAALWLGPDEWLLVAPAEQDVTAVSLEAALAGEPGCVVDVSHRQASFTVSGAGAADALNVGCPLDLGLEAFPVGMSTRTVLAKADIVLWRTAADRWHLECWRSFAPYVHAFLGEAARDDAEI